MELDLSGRGHPALPFLAKLENASEIYDMARDKSPKARKDLMQLVSGILNTEVKPRESELIADILIELLRQAEKDLRLALSVRLSSIENVPLRLILELANDEIEVAKPVLQHSPVLGEFDLVYIIKSKPAEYWQVIAQRKNLTNMVIKTLAETKDFSTALTILQNNHIELSEEVMVALSDMARGSDLLSAPLLRRSEITKDIIDGLYMYVGETLKEFIRVNYSTVNVDLVNAVDKTVQSFVTEDKLQDAAVRQEEKSCELKRAKDMMAAGTLGVKEMLETLRMSQLKIFEAQLAAFSGMTPEFIDSVIKQSSGQKLALVCKAFGISKPDFISIFLLTSKVRDFGRVADVKDIAKAVAYYEKVSQELAAGFLQGQDAGDK